MSHRPSVWGRDRDRVERIDSEPALRVFIDLPPASGINIQRDTMICERKNRFVDWLSIYRSHLQRRQNPHAAPAPVRFLKQNLFRYDDERVIFG
jgi:hypothetical protein